MSRLNDLRFESEVIDASSSSFRDQSNEEWFKLRMKIKPEALKGIAEGDSWFDYPPAWVSDISLGDLINQLNMRSKINLLRVAKAGDTLENMTFGTNPLVNSPQLVKALALIDKYEPDFFLFSGVGNDVAGPNGFKFEPFLHHSRSQLSTIHLKEDYLDFMTNKVFYEMFEFLIKEVISAKSDIKIFLHGYGYPTPDGRAVIEIGDYEFIGPWFEPALRRKGISQAEGKVIAKRLIDSLNEMLKDLSDKYPNNVYHIDLRTIIKDGDWENELHLSAQGFKKVADEMERTILEAFGV
ncbi:hypothetical protein [Acaryochloris marina]|uniref:hypothetical protein n=1 Tax=Acaryochloris marina TaxID=155978 RepID=UPI0021C482FD|nr:hypothetical protein [Acaryochloris marina]BDM83107.1 hypothetical protein AM10699_59680 [Acaryochloris marina MBIC10699]